MRTLVFDEFEFDSPDAEESLEVSIATKRDRPLPGAPEFAAMVCGPGSVPAIPTPTALDACTREQLVREYLQRFANIMIPAP
jgi:hypothetical protein